MTKLLLILVLIITIPRWAQTLAQVDTFTIAGIPITAIGEGIVLEIACFYLINAYGKAYEEAQRYKAAWEAHDARMRDQGKQNHKPADDPELAGYKQLMALYYVLLGLTVVSQWPFLMSTLTGYPVTTLLPFSAQWGYTLFLVVAPEIVTYALARAMHFGRICKRRATDRDNVGQDAQAKRGLWAILGAQIGNLGELRAQWRTMRDITTQTVITTDTLSDKPDTITELRDDLSADARRDALIGVCKRNPGLKPAQVAAQFAEPLGVSTRTVGRDLERLADAGRIRVNGHGVEVVERN